MTALNQWVKQQYDHSFLKAGPRMAIPLFLYFLNYTVGRKLLNDGNQTADLKCRELPLNHLNQATTLMTILCFRKKISSKKDYFSSVQSDQAWSVTSELFVDSLFVVFRVIKLSR